jgi:UDP-glucose 4-epimerase
LKAAGESVEKPLTYYDNNVNGSIRLLEVMSKYEVRTLIFSSSATVYGVPRSLPLMEDHALSPVNPYGQTKLVVENLLRDLQAGTCNWRIALLRYFNPVGAHPTGLIGEAPQGDPSNLMPYIAQVATGKRSKLSIFGHDYDTPDGTGVRDYIHVMDLARGHIAALQHFEAVSPSILTVNLGTGNGYSVLEMICAFEKASGKAVPFEFKPRRPGDVDACWADTRKAFDILGWRATLGIDDMCLDAWRWESNSGG